MPLLCPVGSLHADESDCRPPLRVRQVRTRCHSRQQGFPMSMQSLRTDASLRTFQRVLLQSSDRQYVKLHQPAGNSAIASRSVWLAAGQPPEDVKLSQACQLGDENLFQAMLTSRPNMVATLSEEERRQIADAATNNNANAVRLMLGAVLAGRRSR